MYVYIQAAWFSSVSSIRMLATFEYTKVEYTYVYKPRDSRVSQAFECLQCLNIRKSNARIYSHVISNHVILECFKHLNVRNIRIYESRMHIYIQVMWFSSISSIRMLATFEYTKVECTKVEYTKVECTKVEYTKVERTKVKCTKVVCIQRVILKCLKHSNVRNIRMHVCI